MKNWDFSKYLIAASLVSYALCLATPAFYSAVDPEPVYGIYVLLFGSLGMARGGGAWFANISIAAAYIFMFKRKYGFSLGSSIISVFLALTVLQQMKIDGTKITFMGFGYWAWIFSMLCLGCAAIVRIRSVK